MPHPPDRVHRLELPTPFAIGPVSCWVLRGEPLTIVDPGPRRGKPLSSRRSKDFNRNHPQRRTRHSHSLRDRRMRASVRAATTGGDLRPGRIVRATDFRIEARDRIALIKTATRAIETIEMAAMAARGISGPIAILSRRVNLPQMLRRRGFPPS